MNYRELKNCLLTLRKLDAIQFRVFQKLETLPKEIKGQFWQIATPYIHGRTDEFPEEPLFKLINGGGHGTVQTSEKGT